MLSVEQNPTRWVTCTLKTLKIPLKLTFYDDLIRPTDTDKLFSSDTCQSMKHRIANER